MRLSLEVRSDNLSNLSFYARYAHTAYGEPSDSALAPSGDALAVASHSPFRFKGYLFDGETGLYYLNARYYDPSSGRFASPDGFAYLDPWALGFGPNPYAYCGCSPLARFDQGGHSSIVVFLILLVVAAAVVVTVTDAQEITSEAVYEESLENGGVEIRNSHRIHTPWVRFAYSIYTRYFNPNTAGKIKGTAVGIEFEWFCHNLYYFFHPVNEAADTSIGQTIFHDDSHDKKSFLMKTLYVLSQPPVFWVFDLIAWLRSD